MRVGWSVTSELSAVAETGMAKRVPSESTNSTFAVNDIGRFATNATTTRSFCFEMPTRLPSGNSTVRGARSLSTGTFASTCRLS